MYEPWNNTFRFNEGHIAAFNTYLMLKVTVLNKWCRLKLWTLWKVITALPNTAIELGLPSHIWQWNKLITLLNASYKSYKKDSLKCKILQTNLAVTINKDNSILCMEDTKIFNRNTKATFHFARVNVPRVKFVINFPISVPVSWVMTIAISLSKLSEATK